MKLPPTISCSASRFPPGVGTRWQCCRVRDCVADSVRSQGVARTEDQLWLPRLGDQAGEAGWSHEDYLSLPACDTRIRATSPILYPNGVNECLCSSVANKPGAGAKHGEVRDRELPRSAAQPQERILQPRRRRRCPQPLRVGFHS